MTIKLDPGQAYKSNFDGLRGVFIPFIPNADTRQLAASRAVLKKPSRADETEPSPARAAVRRVPQHPRQQVPLSRKEAGSSQQLFNSPPHKQFEYSLPFKMRKLKWLRGIEKLVH